MQEGEEEAAEKDEIGEGLEEEEKEEPMKRETWFTMLGFT